MWLLALIACQPGEEAGDTAAPYLAEEDDFVLPAWDAEAGAEALSDTLAALFTFTGAPVPAAWQDFFEGADRDCPTWYSDEGTDYWFDTCTARSGTSFDGYGIYYDFDGSVYDDGNAWLGAGVYAFATLTDPQGAVLSLSGTAVAVADVGIKNSQWYSAVDGSFSLEGSGAEGTWLTDGLEPGLTLLALQSRETGAHALQIVGSVSALQGPLETVAFKDVLVADASAGNPCPEEPAGSLSLRDADGAWIDVIFDLSYDEQSGFTLTDPAACDGCGRTWYRGESLGATCLDWAALLEWGDAGPW